MTTTRTIAFHFDKAVGSLDLDFVGAWEGPVPIHVDRDGITAAVSNIYIQLIARDKAVYEAPIRSSKAFNVTLIINPQSTHPSLELDPMNPEAVPITIKRLTQETADSFFKAIPSLQAASPENKAVASQGQLEEKLNNSSSSSLEQAPVAAAATASSTDKAPAPQASSLGTITRLPRKELTEQFIELFKKMHERFEHTLVERSNGMGYNFGDYLMNCLFEKATSHHFNSETGEFTITFDEVQAFNLSKLPEEISPETKAGLSILQNSILTFPIQVKGKFFEDEVSKDKVSKVKIPKVSFEPGSLTITWPKSWTGATANLLEIYQTQNGTITMAVKYGIFPMHICVPAQDFANFVECNLPK